MSGGAEGGTEAGPLDAWQQRGENVVHTVLSFNMSELAFQENRMDRRYHCHVIHIELGPRSAPLDLPEFT